MPMQSSQQTILFVAPSAYPLGGVQTWLDYLLPGLQSIGFRAVLALTSGKHHDIDAYIASHPFKNIEIVSAPTGTAQGRVEALERLIIKVNPTITVNVNIIDVYQAVNNLRQKHLSKTHLVTSIHGIQENLFDGINSNVSIIDAVVSTNRLTQSLINNATGFSADRSYYAAYGVNEDIARVEKSGDKFTIAYAGRIEETQKNISDLLEIFSRLLAEISDIEIIIAGAGEDISALEAWLKKEVQYAEKIKYLGVIAPENVAQAVYQKADVLLLTSEWETGPIVAWEAMSQEVCFVSSRYIGSVEENSLLDGENCMLFDIGDINEAVKKIHILQDKQVQAKLVAGGKQLIQQRYTHVKSVESWAACFANIVEKTPKPFSKNTNSYIEHGRLNTFVKLFLGSAGPRFAEKIRRTFGLHFIHKTAGGEWPHSYPDHTIEPIKLDKYIDSRER